MPEDITTVVPGADDAAQGQAAEEQIPVAESLDDGAEDTISVEDVLGTLPEQQTETPEGENGAASGEEPETDPAPPPTDNKTTESPKETSPIKSQADFDRALGARLAAERKKTAPLVEFARQIQQMYPGKKPEEIVQELTDYRAEALGFTPEQMAYMQGMKIQPQQDQEPEEATMEPSPTLNVEELVNRIIEDTPAIKAAFPDFDPKTFIQDAGAVQLMKAGMPPMDAYRYSNMDKLIADAAAKARTEGERAAAERVKNRNARVPTSTKGSSGAVGPMRPEDWTDAEIEKIDAQVKAGKRVVFLG